MLRGFGFVLVLLVCLVPVAGAQVDAGVKQPRGFVPPAKVLENPRLQSQLAGVAEAARQRGAAAGLQTARARGLETAQGKVRVIVEGAANAARNAVVAQGGSVEASAGELTEALVPVAALNGIAGAAGIDYVRAPFTPYPLALTHSEGIAASDADDWHAVGAKGAGVKIGVIDLGFAGLASRKAADEIPPTAVSWDGCGSMGEPEEHGTAVAEIVHEMAPEAQLYLMCVDSEVDLAFAKDYAKANGITVVNHSVGWYNTSRGDGTGGAGTPDAIVADARANGILWVNAAGNAAQEHWSGTFVDANADDLHEFALGDVTNSIVLPTSVEVCGFLKWDAWPATNQDFDLYLGRDSDFAIVAGSENEQTGSQTPTEEFCYTNPGASGTFSFLISRFSGSSAPRFDLFVTLSDALEHRTVAGSVIEPATSPAALAVGAICWRDDSLEPYSSLGPTIDGRTKPDLAASASVTSPIYGGGGACTFTGFSGTSASAPHVAGAAGLLKGMFPLATVGELQSWLESDALDLGPAGKDSSTGAGKLRLPISSPPAPTTSTPAPGPEDVTYQSFEVAGNTAAGGITTSYYWEYGETTAYGSQTTPVSLASPRTGQAVDGVLTGLNAGTEYHYRLVAVNPFGTSAGEDRTQTTAPALPPDAAPAPPQELGANSARLAGTVTPNTAVSEARFEWGETTAYGNVTALQPAGTFGTNTIAAEITGLEPNTLYHFRVIATNVHGQTTSSDGTFTTVTGGAPTGVTGASSAVTTGTATVAADIIPNGLETSYTFEYGTSPAGQLQTSPAAVAGYGTNTRTVTTGLSGLQPGTQYRYRVVASNSAGTSTGDFETFTTVATPPPPPVISGSGGGGGGGGVADLAIEGYAQPATAAVGDDVTYYLKVTDVNGPLAQGVNVDVQLPAGSQLTGSYADRGAGCSGALVCNLDFLSSASPVGTIRLHTKVTAAGEQALKATVRYVAFDPKPENNTVTIVVGNRSVAQPGTPKPPTTTPPATKTGTTAANTIRGSFRADTLRGLGGNDRLFGLGGADRLFGGVGHDRLYGGSGNDRLYGGSGNDRLFGGNGRDLFEGGAGADVVSARDRTKDTIRCGAGRDTVTADRGDVVARDCERVTRR